MAQIQLQIDIAKKQDAIIAGQIKDNEKAVIQTKKDLVKTAAELSKVEDDKAKVQQKIKVLLAKKEMLSKRIAENSENLRNAAAGLVEISVTGTTFDNAKADDYMLSMSLLSAISDGFDRDMKTAAAEIKELNKLQAELEKEQGTFAAFEKKRKKEQAELDKLLRTRGTQNQNLRGKQYELQKKLGSLSAAAKNLAELTGKISVAPTAPKGGAGRMKTPISGMMLLRFGDVGSTGFRSDGWRVRTNPDALVVASGDGKIEFADNFRRYNHIVIINHGNGYLSVLTGMDKINVLVGQDVIGGEPIGRMPSSSPEFYMELHKNGQAINPAQVFKEPR